VGFAAGPNLYTYGKDDPQLRTDPTGLIPIVCECRVSRFGGFQGWTTYQSAIVECTTLAANCCRAACASNDPLVTSSWTGNWYM